jgi:glycosyltransferase involved in cell wall biosynthesis
VVYFGNDWFAENRTSSHHIARRLAGVVPVLYIETPGARAPQSNRRDLRKLWRKVTRAFALPRPVSGRLHVATIPQIPFRKVPLVDRLNRALGVWLTRRAIRRLGFGPRISWFAVPHPGHLAKRLGEALAVYYCIDDYAAHPGMDPAAIQKLDDQLTRDADLVFVAPPALVEAKRALNPRVHFAPHGVDFDHFASPGGAAAETRTLIHPIVGYFGTLGEWIDYDLLASLARARPRWTFLCIGYAAADLGPLRECSNVVLPGPQPYERLPQWAQSFDVAVIPYRQTRQVQHANPLKLREYLATGKPVVSVTTPETARFADSVYLADGAAAFLAAIDRALAEDCPQRRRQRMDAVRGLSWDARFQETVRLVDALLATRSANSPKF